MTAVPSFGYVVLYNCFSEQAFWFDKKNSTRSITALRLVTLCITLPYSTCSNRLFTPNQTLRQNPTWLCCGQFRIIDMTGTVVWSGVVKFPVFTMVSSLPGDKLEHDVDCDDPKSWAGRNLSHRGSLWRLLCPAAGAQDVLKSKWMAAFCCSAGFGVD